MAFLEEDDPFSPTGTQPADDRFGQADPRQQFLFRRLAAVAVGILILILIVLGVKGCLDARKERGFENYVRDLDALAAESQQLSQEFFGRLENPENLSELEFENDVKGDRGAAEGLASRAQDLDAPGELESAQADLVLAFDLRRDGLAAISAEIGTALGDEGSDEAIDAIAEDMQFFVASDVLYRRAEAQIDEVLTQENIQAQAPESQFLPSVDWLDPTTVAEALAPVSGDEKATSGVHGLGLLQVTAQPGDVVLDSATPVTVSGGGEPTLDIEVQNQGESEESDIPVTVEVDGDNAGEGTIDQIAAGEVETVTIPLDPASAAGQPVTIDVSVEPVLGEQVEDNNTATYEVTFE